MTRFFLTAAVALAPALPALAQDGTTLQVAESEAFGSYLTNGEGAPLYAFTADTQGTADAAPVISCNPDCLQAWPLVTGDAPEAGEGVDASMIGTMDHEGQSVVTYNGWPLYTFTQDQGSDTPQGQDIESFGGEWYLVGPDGTIVEEHEA